LEKKYRQYEIRVLKGLNIKMNDGPMNGWCGTILDINLTTGEIIRRKLDKDDARLFLGGRGLNSKTLFDRVPPAADPLGPENILCVSPPEY
jgi:aldehyde:ferredoxin oxidoreductase